MKNISNPTIYNVMIIFLKDELKQKPIAIGLLRRLIKGEHDSNSGCDVFYT